MKLKIKEKNEHMETKQYATKKRKKNQWVNHEIKEEIRKCLQRNENENTILQSRWDAEKPVLRGKHTAIQALLKKQENSQVNNVTYH